MLNIRYCLLASVAVLLSAPASAMSMNQSPGMLPKTTVNSLNNQQLSAQFLGLKLSNISNFPQTATVCFVTDTEKCTGYEFDNGDGSGGGSGGGFPDYNPDPDKRCEKEGYTKITCNSMEIPTNKCPYDETYIEECVCKPGLIPCNAPSVGIGPACDGKYESCCKDECPSGYATGSGACKQASSLKTACGNACYKILNNTCNMGSLNPPSEGGGYKNKIVYTTECGNPCWQSYNDNCGSGYVKDKVAGKCYDTNVTYTDFGSACYKEISCCTNSCKLNSCPSGAICSKEDCSGKFCITGCSYPLVSQVSSGVTSCVCPPSYDACSAFGPAENAIQCKDPVTGNTVYSSCTTCQPGYMYYVDKTILPYYTTSKPYLGIVLDCNRRIIMAVKDNICPQTKWGPEDAALLSKLPQYPDTNKNGAISDFDGEKSSKIISDYINSTGYKTSRGDKGYVYCCVNQHKVNGVGGWYYPSAGELNLLTNTSTHSAVKTMINNILGQLWYQAFDSNSVTISYYYTSPNFKNTWKFTSVGGMYWQGEGFNSWAVYGRCFKKF